MKHMKDINITSLLLLPISIIYGLSIFLYNLLAISYKSKIRGVCVGNITMGGTGKTPVAINLIHKFKKSGYKNIIVVSRGYKGSIIEPTLVDLKKHKVQQVGDEPLIIAKHTKVVVAKNKKAGVKYAESLGADMIILDDGLQNPTVKKDKTVVVVDGYKGFSNNLVFPSGEKREFIFNRLKNANAIVVTGIRGDIYKTLQDKYGDKVYFASYEVEKKPFSDNQSVVAFSGLGNNEKFFETVRKCSYPIRAKLSYPDHYQYTDKDLEDLHGIAGKALAKLITTEKDFVRLSKKQKQNITPLLIKIVFDKEINL